MVVKAVRILGAGILFLILSGCAVVKPYEREHLADPIMGLQGDTKQSAAEKLYSTAEGSAGGEEGLTGGCGCSK